MKLLLIDSDSNFVRQLETELRQCSRVGNKLVHVNDLEHGADLASRHDFQVILLSDPVEGCRTDHACRQLAAAAPNAVLLLLTEDSSAHPYDDLIEYVDDFLSKSALEADQVMRRISIAIERRKRRIERSHTADGVHTEPLSFASVSAGATAAGATATMPMMHTPTIIEASATPLRVLHVDGDVGYSRLLENSLASALQIQCDVQRVGRLADALKCLVNSAYDVILVDPELPDSPVVNTLTQMRPYAEEASIIVLAKEESEEQSLVSLKHGAEDCLFKSQLDTKALVHSIRLAVARKSKRANVFDNKRAKASVSETKQAAELGPRPADRRTQPRYLKTRSLIVIPVLANGQPFAAYQAEGFTIDVSEGGIGFEVSGLERLPTKRLVVGIESDDGYMHYATVEVRAVLSVHGALRIGGKFSSNDRDVLRMENFMPRVNHHSHRFETGMPTETLYKWGELGICQPMLLDRVFVCPECKALPTVRQGCRACGSVRTAASQLIHHFACAHVELVTAFERRGELVCPKCRARNLVVGTDFEYLAGPYTCLDCEWSDIELELVAQCMACELRFPIDQSSEEEIIGYHVHRLDPLALVAQP